MPRADIENSYRYQQIAQRIDPEGKLLRASSLTGGVSAQVTALEIERANGQVQKLIVRQHGTVDRQQNPDIASTEFRLLHHLYSAGIPVPQPILVDESNAIFPLPYIVVEYLEGQTVFEPTNLADYVQQLAATLAQIHRLDSAPLTFLFDKTRFYVEQFQERPAVLDESLDAGRIRAALEARWPPATMNSTSLLHGDFWPGNILWRDEKLAAVIDWEDAALGDPLEDLANARLEILWAFGRDAMQQFTAQYQALMSDMDYRNLPIWDLCAALRPAGKLVTWGLDASTEKRFRERHRWFVNQAISRLGGG